MIAHNLYEKCSYLIFAESFTSATGKMLQAPFENGLTSSWVIHEKIEKMDYCQCVYIQNILHEF